MNRELYPALFLKDFKHHCGIRDKCLGPWISPPMGQQGTGTAARLQPFSQMPGNGTAAPIRSE